MKMQTLKMVARQAGAFVKLEGKMSTAGNVLELILEVIVPEELVLVVDLRKLFSLRRLILCCLLNALTCSIANGQSEYGTLFISSRELIWSIPDSIHIRVQSIDFDSDSIWLFAKGEVYVSSLGENDGWHQIILPNENFIPTKTFVDGNGDRLYQSSDQRLLNGRSATLIQFDRKHKMNYVIPNTDKRIIRIRGDDYVMLMYGGVPGYLSNTDANRISKHYKTSPLIGVFDKDGAFRESFAKYDSVYHKAGTQWARDFFAVYHQPSDEYWLGNVLNPRVSRYNSDYEYQGAFGHFPAEYDYNIPIIESPRHGNLVGLQYFVERHQFHDLIVLDDRVGRLYAKPSVDTTTLDKSYIHFLFIEEKEKGICSKPNPILENQDKIIKQKDYFIQWYGLPKFKYLGDTPTSIKLDSKYYGFSSTKEHVFLDYIYREERKALKAILMSFSEQDEEVE